MELLRITLDDRSVIYLEPSSNGPPIWQVPTQTSQELSQIIAAVGCDTLAVPIKWQRHIHHGEPLQLHVVRGSQMSHQRYSTIGNVADCRPVHDMNGPPRDGAGMIVDDPSPALSTI